MILLIYQLVLVFVVGAIVGSFCNVAIARLPWEKSLIWPGSRCGSCLQPVRWYDNLPLVSYLWLRGQCRNCRETFSSRYFWVELLTALGFVGLFVLEVVRNIHQWPDPQAARWRPQFFFPWAWQLGFLFHALLFTFLLIASACDLDGREIPFPLTMTGTIVGLIGATLLPWPYPWTPVEATPNVQLGIEPGYEWILPEGGLKAGIQAWPVWGPLPAWLVPGGNWQTGLMTGLAGALVGSMLIRMVRFLFSWGFGREAMGMGDADLMMMAGSFLGWQPIVVAFFVSIGPALVFGLIQLVVRRDHSLPFGPSLATGVLCAMLGWRWLGPMVQPLMFWPIILAALVLFMAVFLVLASFMLRRPALETPQSNP